METTITILRDNAPFAAMLLLAVLYLRQDVTELRSDMDQRFTDMDRRFTEVGQDITEMGQGIAGLGSDTDRGFTEVRSDIAGLGERMARVESKVDGMDNRLSRVEGLLDEMRPLDMNTTDAQGMGKARAEAATEAIHTSEREPAAHLAGETGLGAAPEEVRKMRAGFRQYRLGESPEFGERLPIFAKLFPI